MHAAPPCRSGEFDSRFFRRGAVRPASEFPSLALKRSSFSASSSSAYQPSAFAGLMAVATCVEALWICAQVSAVCMARLMLLAMSNFCM